MNKEKLLTMLKEEIELDALNDDFTAECCTNYLGRSSLNDICFYYLKESQIAEQRLQKRLSLAQAGIIIFNRKPFIDINTNYIVIKKGLWPRAQKIICDYFYPVDWNFKKIIGVTGN